MRRKKTVLVKGYCLFRCTKLLKMKLKYVITNIVECIEMSEVICYNSRK